MFLEWWNIAKCLSNILTKFFVSTLCGDCKNMQEIGISLWLFELTPQNRIANSTNPAAIFGPNWSALKKTLMDLNFLRISPTSLSSTRQKMLSNVGKTF